MIPRHILQTGRLIPSTLAKQVPCAFARRVSSRAFASKPNPSSNRSYSRAFAGVSALSACAIAAFGLQTLSGNVQLDSGNKDTPPQPSTLSVLNGEGDAFVKPPTNSPAFPRVVQLPGESSPYELLGIGVRSVSFLSFHVYAVGIYINSEDKAAARKILKADNEGPAQGDLHAALLGPETGTEIISHLLDNNIRIDIRIVPVRNTDFGHLRDGFVRGILGHPRYKQLTSASPESKGDPDHIKLLENLGEGVNELKVAFSRKMSVPKHNILHLVRKADGSLNISYYKGVSENSPSTEKIELGTVKNPEISKIMLLNYLAGKSPASESARASAVDGLVDILN